MKSSRTSCSFEGGVRLRFWSSEVGIVVVAVVVEDEDIVIYMEGCGQGVTGDVGMNVKNAVGSAKRLVRGW